MGEVTVGEGLVTWRRGEKEGKGRIETEGRGREKGRTHVILEPVAIGVTGNAAVLRDFKPLGLGRVKGRAVGGAAGRQVGQHGADVVGPLEGLE